MCYGRLKERRCPDLPFHAAKLQDIVLKIKAIICGREVHSNGGSERLATTIDISHKELRRTILFVELSNLKNADDAILALAIQEDHTECPLA